MCGSGPELAAAKGRVQALGLEGRIVFHGFLRDPLPELRQCLFQVVPSIWQEPLGLVALEAKFHGVPAVVFPSGGLPEMIQHKVDGYVCRESSIEALIEAILWMLSPEANLPLMNQSALADSDARFGTHRYREKWADVFIQSRRPHVP